MAYAVSRRITIFPAKVPGDLTNYAFAFTITDADLAVVGSGGSVQNTDATGGIGGDIEVPADMIFAANADGSSQYDHEFEDYDKTSGMIVAWVRVPSVSSIIATNFYILYGDAAVVVSQENINPAWAANFENVYHVAEEVAGVGNANAYKDSTSQADHGTDEISAVDQTGKIGPGHEFDGDDYISVAGTADLNNASKSLEAWVNPDAVNSYRMIMRKSHDFDLRVLNGNLEANRWNGDAWKCWSTSGAPIGAGSWYYVVFTYDQSTDTGILYINGSPVATGTSTGTDSASSILQIGRMLRNGGHDYYWDGHEDECRISNDVRSADYVGAVWNNIDDPATFFGIDVARSKAQLDQLVPVIETSSGVKRQLDQLLPVMEVVFGAKRQLDQLLVILEVAPNTLNVSQFEALADWLDKRIAVSQFEVMLEYLPTTDENMTQVRGWNQILPRTVIPSRLSPAIGGRGIGGGGIQPLILKPWRVEQAATPTVPPGELWIWRDAGTGQLWLLYQDPTAGLMKCQLT